MSLRNRFLFKNQFGLYFVICSFILNQIAIPDSFSASSEQEEMQQSASFSSSPLLENANDTDDYDDNLKLEAEIEKISEDFWQAKYNDCKKKLASGVATVGTCALGVAGCGIYFIGPSLYRYYNAFGQSMLEGYSCP